MKLACHNCYRLSDQEDYADGCPHCRWSRAGGRPADPTDGRQSAIFPADDVPESLDPQPDGFAVHAASGKSSRRLGRAYRAYQVKLFFYGLVFAGISLGLVWGAVYWGEDTERLKDVYLSPSTFFGARDMVGVLAILVAVLTFVGGTGLAGYALYRLATGVPSPPKSPQGVARRFVDFTRPAFGRDGTHVPAYVCLSSASREAFGGSYQAFSEFCEEVSRQVQVALGRIQRHRHTGNEFHHGKEFVALENVSVDEVEVTSLEEDKATCRVTCTVASKERSDDGTAHEPPKCVLSENLELVREDDGWRINQAHRTLKLIRQPKAHSEEAGILIDVRPKLEQAAAGS